MIIEMAELLILLNCNVTFPVRLNCAALSFKNLNLLMSKSDLFSLTFWSCKNDIYNQENLCHFDEAKSFIDVYM